MNDLQTQPGHAEKSEDRPSQSNGVIHRVRNEATEKDMPAIPWCSPIREQKSCDLQTVVDADVTCPHCRVMIDRHKAELAKARAAVMVDVDSPEIRKELADQARAKIDARQAAGLPTDEREFDPPQQDKRPIFAHILDPIRQGDNALCGETGTISQTTSIAEASCPKCLAIAGEMLADQVGDEIGQTSTLLGRLAETITESDARHERAIELRQAEVDALRDIAEQLNDVAKFARWCMELDKKVSIQNQELSPADG